MNEMSVTFTSIFHDDVGGQPPRSMLEYVVGKLRRRAFVGEEYGSRGLVPTVVQHKHTCNVHR